MLFILTRTNAIAFGFITYTYLKIATGNSVQVAKGVYILTAGVADYLKQNTLCYTLAAI